MPSSKPPKLALGHGRRQRARLGERAVERRVVDGVDARRADAAPDGDARLHDLVDDVARSA